MKRALLILVGSVTFAACEAPRIVDASELHAECPVCRAEGDLACVDVAVRASTPRTEWGGSTFYFCSDDCRRTFERAPQRYVAQR